MKKILMILLILLVFILIPSVIYATEYDIESTDEYKYGYESGYADGYEYGYEDGCTEECEESLLSYEQSYDIGYDAGHTEGRMSTYYHEEFSDIPNFDTTVLNENSYIDGYIEGYDDGYEESHPYENEKGICFNIIGTILLSLFVCFSAVCFSSYKINSNMLETPNLHNTDIYNGEEQITFFDNIHNDYWKNEGYINAKKLDLSLIKTRIKNMNNLVLIQLAIFVGICTKFIASNNLELIILILILICSFIISLYIGNAISLPFLSSFNCEINYNDYFDTDENYYNYARKERYKNKDLLVAQYKNDRCCGYLNDLYYKLESYLNVITYISIALATLIAFIFVFIA